MNEYLIKATLRLFKAVPITHNKLECQLDPLFFKDTIPSGFILSPKVNQEYYGNRSNLVFVIQKIYGLSAEQLNQSFHKSWNKIKDSSLEQLYIEQIAHYCTTYGKGMEHQYLDEKGEQWGVDNLANKVANLEDFEMNKVWDADYIYIPKEVLQIPDLENESLKLVIIKGYTKEELKAKLLKLLGSGIALKDTTILDVVEVATYVELSVDEVLKLKNKEVKCIMFDKLGLIPENPVEFLRLVIYKCTGETLIIKNKELIDKIKEKMNSEISELFVKYSQIYNIKELATIFYRFKPLFLCFRDGIISRRLINKIRRLAVKYHSPMPMDYLNNVTGLIKKGEGDFTDLWKELGKANVFRKIRLAYALNFRTKNVDSILYKIRNGNAWAANFNFENKDVAESVLEQVLHSIAQDIEPNVLGKVIYIPDYVNYTLPATEKQFTGFFPSGTCVTIDKDLVFGIHWENVNHHRVDLDLSLMSATAKFGWDGYYRSNESEILFSGDMTDAQKPKGATELFYVKKQTNNALILMVNNYNFCDGIEIPFKIIVAKQHLDKLPMNYMVDPNSVLAIADTKILQRQKILGLIVTTPESNKFYFTESAMGKSITSKKVNYLEKSRQFMVDYYTNSISLKEVLERAGAKVVSGLDDPFDIDLSPENLDKNSILSLLIKENK